MLASNPHKPILLGLICTDQLMQQSNHTTRYTSCISCLTIFVMARSVIFVIQHGTPSPFLSAMTRLYNTAPPLFAMARSVIFAMAARWGSSEVSRVRSIVWNNTIRRWRRWWEVAAKTWCKMLVLQTRKLVSEKFWLFLGAARFSVL